MSSSQMIKKQQNKVEKRSVAGNPALFYLNPQDVSYLLEDIEVLHRDCFVGFRLGRACFGLVVGNHVSLVVIDELIDLSVGLYHFLMVAATLNGTSSANFLSHQAEDPTKPSTFLRAEFLEIIPDESDVFNGLGKIPHAKLLITLLGMALSNVLEFLAPDQEK